MFIGTYCHPYLIVSLLDVLSYIHCVLSFSKRDTNPWTVEHFAVGHTSCLITEPGLYCQGPKIPLPDSAPRAVSFAVWSAFLSLESVIHWSFFYALHKSQMVNCIELHFFDIPSTTPGQNLKWLSEITMKDLYTNMNDSWLCVLKSLCYYFSFLVQISAVLQWLSFLLQLP